MDESLEPLEPQGDPESPSTGPRSWSPLFAPATFVLLSLLGVGTVGVFFLFSRGLLSGNLESLESLTVLETNCADVKCTENFLGHNWVATCNGNADSLECINTCCTWDLHCSELGDFCTDQGWRNREITLLDRGMRFRTGRCKGKENCEDTCCQRFCADFTCQPDSCKRPYAPHRCTDSTCQEQCCYNKEEYCGGGFNAWTEACYQCMGKTEWCEDQLDKNRADYSQHQWNRIVFDAVKSDNLVPGCEEDGSPRCGETVLKYHLISVFLLHQTPEGVSANTVAILPGGLDAISGGDDGQVWQWRLSDGRPLKNYTSDIEPILQVAPLNDATYFCSVTRSQAIIWLLQLRDGLEIPGKTELPGDARKGSIPPNNTACIGVNTWETAIVGQDNEFVVLWHWKLDRTMTVPVDPQLSWIQQIKTDAGYHAWPKWDKNDKLQDAFVAWRRHIFGLDQKYDRRLEANVSAESLDRTSKLDATSANLRRLKRSSGPWPNWFSNVRWGDYPKWYYEPKGWGKVVSLAAIPSNLYFVVGYEHGSIRVWRTYNGFIKALIPKAHVGRVNALLPAPAGDVFWSGGDDGWIREWEAASGKALRSHYAAYAGPTLSLAMIPGGNAFYSGHAGGVFLLWLVAETEWALCHVDPGGGKVNSLDVNPGKIGQVVVALENGLVKLYEQR